MRRIDRPVNSDCLIFARTGSFISAKTKEIPYLLRASSRSWSMSAAVVSTSVMGSAATTIQRERSSRSEGSGSFAEGSERRQRKRGIEPEHDQHSSISLGIGIGAKIVIARERRPPARARAVRPPGSAEHIEDASPTAMPIPGSTPRSATPKKAAIDKCEFQFGELPTAARNPGQIGKRERRHDDRGQVGWGRLRNSPGETQA